ncbi:MAG TPA: response regulator [Candidatus Paceibacterota bacterium]|nr:response regulator [Verrucomicrobiota bacterium]HRY49268.1 response regulator [Candidatus Paceibacterota bacterium]HSA00481.1 response regulator [Candidatus Paceibacterota bacterium]
MTQGDQKIRLVLVEDDPAQTAALVGMLKSSPMLELVGAFVSAEEAEPGILALTPEIVLVDMNLPGRSGTDLVRLLKPLLPEASTASSTFRIAWPPCARQAICLPLQASRTEKIRRPQTCHIFMGLGGGTSVDS